MKSQINQFIKILSTILITGALSLDCWNIYLQQHGQSLPPGLSSIFWLGNISLSAHVVEGIIAAIKAPACDRNPLRYGIYTFFVGYVGLQELFND
ncbi:MAG: hypothetical protein AAFQ80_01570 [Cyanobacteria bacterium J06621_8]